MKEFEKYMICQYCKLLLENPYESICCGELFCQKCSNFLENDKCITCFKIHEFRQNFFVKRILNQMSISCFYNCGEKLHSTSLRNHMINCKNRQYTCNVCEDSYFPKEIFSGNKKDFLSHFIENHSDNIIDLNENLKINNFSKKKKFDFDLLIKEEKKELSIEDEKPLLKKNNYFSFLTNIENMGLNCDNNDVNIYEDENLRNIIKEIKYEDECLPGEKINNSLDANNDQNEDYDENQSENIEYSF